MAETMLDEAKKMTAPPSRRVAQGTLGSIPGAPEGQPLNALQPSTGEAPDPSKPVGAAESILPPTDTARGGPDPRPFNGEGGGVRPYDPIKVKPYEGPGYNAERVDPTDPTLGDEDSVESRVASMLDENSALMRRAEALGQMRAEKTGAGSSSMAARAAQSALYDVATPIAQADAETASKYKQLGFNYDTVLGQMNEGQRLKFEEMDKQHNLSQEILQQTQDFQRWSMEQGWSEDLTRSMMNMYTTMSSSAMNSMAAMAGSQQVTEQEGIDFMNSWKDAIASLVTISGLPLDFGV